MPLYYFLLLIVSLSCGSLPTSDAPLDRVLLASVAMVTAWSLLCHVAARVVANQVLAGECEPFAAARLLERQLELFRFLGLGVAVLCLVGFGLGRILDRIPIVANSMLLQSFILLAPATLMTVATWSAEHRYGVRLQYVDAGLRAHLKSLRTAIRGGALWLMTPVLILLGCADLVSMIPLSDTVSQLVIASIVIGGVPIGMPLLMRYLFKTCAIDERDRDWIRSLLGASGACRTRVVCWQTGNTAFNAMVVGFVAPLRTMLLSDRLLAELPRDQLAMVILHEAAHLRRRHMPLRMLGVLPAWVAAAMVTQIAGDAAWAIPLGTTTGILLTLLLLKSLAYRTEHDADVFACRLAAEISSKVQQVPGTERLAAESLALALERVTREHASSSQPTWLHPGVDQRIAFLRERTQPNAKPTAATTIANPA